MTVSSHEVSYEVEAVHYAAVDGVVRLDMVGGPAHETEIRAILAGSDVVVMVFDRSCGRLGGFARVLTDKTYLAVILDVVMWTCCSRHDRVPTHRPRPSP